jgi:hypothetical protein
VTNGPVGTGEDPAAGNAQAVGETPVVRARPVGAPEVVSEPSGGERRPPESPGASAGDRPGTGFVPPA